MNKSISYTYDNVGNRATMTDHDGGVTTYTYDDANRLSSLVNPASQTTSYTYDNGERLIRKDYHNGTYALYTHDNANRLLSVTNKDSLDSWWLTLTRQMLPVTMILVLWRPRIIAQRDKCPCKKKCLNCLV
ncbi:MAG: hypothetical protein ABFS56_33810 [Pseudomonadota bacterium]